MLRKNNVKIIANVENWRVSRDDTLSFTKTLMVHNIKRKH